MGKYCVVPKCKSTSVRTPNKIFFKLPKNNKLRKKWIASMRRQETLSDKTCNLYVCEDHFFLKDDCTNYLENQLMGTRLRLKGGIVPHLYHCQGRSSSIRSEQAISKRERRRLVDDALRNTSENAVQQSEEARLPCPKLPVKGSPSGTESLEVGCYIDIYEEQASDELSKEQNENSSGLSLPIYCEHCGSYLSTTKSHVGSQANIKPKSRSFGVHVTPKLINPCSHASTSPFKKMRSGPTRPAHQEPLASSSSQSSDRSPEFRPSSASGSDFSAEDLNQQEGDRVAKEAWNQKMLTISLQRVHRNPMSFVGLPSGSFFLVKLLSEVLPVHYSHVLLVLKKIRLNESFIIVAEDFGLSESQGSRIFKQSVGLMARSLKELVFWPEGRKILQHLPIAFRYRYGRVEAILDCLEIQIEKPSNPLHQALTWSNYKSCNTIKYLISCTPDGLVNFISEGYGGRASDSYILQDCGFLDKLRRGCVIMADRGFKDIAPLVEKKGSRLIRPPTVRAGTISTKAEVRLTRQIAALRIVVERVIGRLRNFSMLKPHATIDLKLVSSLDFVIQIACGIANMQYHLFKDQI